MVMSFSPSFYFKGQPCDQTRRKKEVAVVVVSLRMRCRLLQQETGKEFVCAVRGDHCCALLLEYFVHLDLTTAADEKSTTAGSIAWTVRSTN